MIENYEEYKRKVLNEPHVSMTIEGSIWTGAVQLAPLPVPTTCVGVECKKKEGKNPMEDKVYYLEGRINSIASEKIIALSNQFGINDDPDPRTPAELVARITAGKYILPDPAKRKAYNALDGIRWRDPSVKEDMDGYNAAISALKVQKIAAKDIIMVKDPATDGLAALQAFEAWQPTVATTTAQ